MVWDIGSNSGTKAIEKKLAGLAPIAKDRCIYKVHEQLRDVEEKAYKSVLLAIGPYNDQDKVGRGFMQEHKLRYLQKMLETTGQRVETYIKALKDLEVNARKYYVECISQTSDEFVEMMLLDGCFIIELFRKFRIKETIDKDDPIFQMKWVRDRIARDLLLFENQLPLFVLVELFGMSKSNVSRNSEHPIDIEENDGITIESSTSIHRTIILTQSLYDLALGFFSESLPFKWNAKASSYNSTERIEDLLRLGCKALTPSLPVNVWERLELGFKFEKKEFEHLLSLIHATISISILDMEIENQGVGNKLKMADQIFKHLFGQIHKSIIYCASKFQNSGFQDNMSENEDWNSIRYGREFQKAGVPFNLVKRLKDKIAETQRWALLSLPFGIELQEAGIEFEQAKKFKDLYHQNSNGVKLKTSDKFKRLLCLDKIDNWKWKSIPHGKELRKAGVKFNKAKKFKDLFDLKKIEGWNIYGASEHEEAGIIFNKAEAECNSFSIKFNNGRLEISPLKITDHTETYLRNLIAYEQYCNEDKHVSYITDYVGFIDDLINSSKDVKLLRQRGIIQNNLGDDEVTSIMVNKLSHNISTSTPSIYARTSRNLNMHCRKRRNKWMATLRRDYFNSPWAWISFLAAVFLLALTIVQTIFSIIP